MTGSYSANDLRTTTQLLAMLASENWWDRRDAAHELVHRADRSAVIPLIECLVDHP